MAGHMEITATKEPTCPSLAEVRAHDERLLAFVMATLKKMNIDALSVIALGTVLSKMTFDGKQTGAQVQMIIADAAKTHHEAIKVEMLRQTVGNNPFTN